MDSIVKRVEEALKQFKSSENSASTKFVESDAVACKILAIWPELSVTLQEPLVFGTMPMHKANQWKYVWKFRRIDYKEIEKRIGLDDRRLLQEKIDLLITHQLIYPDGSLSGPARSLLSSR